MLRLACLTLSHLNITPKYQTSNIYTCISTHTDSFDQQHLPQHQDDSTTALNFGTQVFTRGLSGDSTTQWITHYYRVVAGTGASYDSYVGSNGVSAPALYVRKMLNPWVNVGTLSSYWSLVNSGTYNPLLHEVWLLIILFSFI